MTTLLLVLSLHSEGTSIVLGTHTDYKDSHFITDVNYIVDAPYSTLSDVLDELFVGMQKHPTQDAKWAWAGLGRKKSVDEDLNLHENGVKYNAKTNDYVLTLLIGQPDKDPMSIDIEGFLLRNSRPQTKFLQLGITKKVKILTDANFVVSAMPYGKDRSILSVHTSICFGWFFNIFFTRSRYTSILEWRINGFARNVENRAENNYKNLLIEKQNADKNTSGESPTERD